MTYKDPNYKRNYYKKNEEKIVMQQREWREKNKEKKRAADKAYYENNKPRILQRIKDKAAENPGAAYAKNVAWRAKNPAKVAEQHQRKRARKRAAPLNDLTAAQWQEIQAVHDHCCVYCGRRAKGHLTQDHIIPLAKGGNHTASNIVPACRPCNLKKNVGPPLVPVQPLLLTVAPPRKKKGSL